VCGWLDVQRDGPHSALRSSQGGATNASFLSLTYANWSPMPPVEVCGWLVVLCDGPHSAFRSSPSGPTNASVLSFTYANRSSMPPGVVCKGWSSYAMVYIPHYIVACQVAPQMPISCQLRTRYANWSPTTNASNLDFDWRQASRRHSSSKTTISARPPGHPGCWLSPNIIS
jgi:hypothetical protein